MTFDTQHLDREIRMLAAHLEVIHGSLSLVALHLEMPKTAKMHRHFRQELAETFTGGIKSNTPPEGTPV